ncbi:hypothetical protein E2C01_018238 [Portunus trituberculatus]|uniref:Secreted protein n=1 Tax=Portunus trituberculatus TaxID=210409 RepID=A0A5B7DVL1_PORTR|nr:hypothetical protein [Portunus trituberculatus]
MSSSATLHRNVQLAVTCFTCLHVLALPHTRVPQALMVAIYSHCSSMIHYLCSLTYKQHDVAPTYLAKV